MDLTKKLNGEIDFNLLEKLSSLPKAKNMVRKFEKYYGTIPTEQNFYKIYLKYLECQILNGKVFNSFGTIKKLAVHYLNPNFLRFRLTQFKLLENYLFQKKIIKEKVFE